MEDKVRYVLDRADEGYGIWYSSKELGYSRYWLYLCLHRSGMFEEYKRRLKEGRKKRKVMELNERRIERWKKRVGEEIYRLVEEKFGKVLKIGRYNAYALTEYGYKVYIRKGVIWKVNNKKYIRFSRLKDPNGYYILIFHKPIDIIKGGCSTYLIPANNL